jgi:hypothetical protein
VDQTSERSLRLDLVVVRPAQQGEERFGPVLALHCVASLACVAVVNRTASNAKTAREVRHEVEKMWRAHSRVPIRASRGRMPSRRFRGRQPRGPRGKARSPVRRTLLPGFRPRLLVVNLASGAEPERGSPRRCTYGMSGWSRRMTTRNAAWRSASLMLWSARRRATTSAGSCSSAKRRATSRSASGCRPSAS